MLERRCRELDREVSRWGSKSLAANVWVQRVWASAMLGAPVDPNEAHDCDLRELDDARIEARSGIPTTKYVHAVNLALFRLLHGDRRRVLDEDLPTLRRLAAAMPSLWLLARTALILIVAIEGSCAKPSPSSSTSKGLADRSRVGVRGPACGPINEAARIVRASQP